MGAQRNSAMNYTLSDFDYELPEDLIAQEPVHPRDRARLLVYNRQTGELQDDHFYNLTDHLPVNTRLVLNNSKVEKCRLLFDDGAKEVFILNATDNRRVEALVRPGKKFRKGRTVRLTDRISAKVVDVDEEGIRALEMTPPLDDERYEKHKHTPFPPYIEQNESLADEYQTVYARAMGSKAAPTAGLHFTDALLEKIERSGTGRSEVTLHVGLGTFAPVKADTIDEHTMHSEWYSIDEATAGELNESAHLTAVGTTSVRVLESAIRRHGRFIADEAETDIFIKPGYRFRATDALITNFHLPKSTLLMLVAAFMGYEDMREVYRHAISEEYRFYSFGDAMLIL